MTTTTALWDQADAQLAELVAAGEALRSTFAGGKAQAASLQPVIGRDAQRSSASSPR